MSGTNHNGLVLGVDGGGTKSDFFLFTTDGRLAGYARGGATNHESYLGGFDEMTPVFDGILDEALKGAGAQIGDISAAVFGMAGIDVVSQKRRMEDYVAGRGIKNSLVFNDSFLGIKAACSKGYGISFVNGTGNSVGGIDKNGNWLQVGGTGEAFGDVGGASGISKLVVRTVYSQFYRCGEKTSMSDKFMALLGIDDPAMFTEAVYAKIYTGQVGHKDIHNEVLYAAANEGDAVAVGLLESVGGEFALSIGGCINNLDFDGEAGVEVVLIGSASLKARSSVMLDACAARTKELTGKEITLLPLGHPPASGAVIWALELALGANAAAALREKVAGEIEKNL